MEQSKPWGKEPATQQAWAFTPYEDSQLPLFTDYTNELDGVQTANAFDASIDATQIAQAAIDYRPKHHQALKMESIKALLRSFLDDIKEPQKERSSSFDGLLSQWIDIWRRDRSHSLLIYVLGDRSEQYGNRMPAFNDLETIDKTKVRVLEQHCLQQGICLHLAKLTRVVNTDPYNFSNLNVVASLHEMRDLSGRLLDIRPFTVENESILQNSILKENQQQQIVHQKVRTFRISSFLFGSNFGPHGTVSSTFRSKSFTFGGNSRLHTVFSYVSTQTFCVWWQVWVTYNLSFHTFRERSFKFSRTFRLYIISRLRKDFPAPLSNLVPRPSTSNSDADSEFCVALFQCHEELPGLGKPHFMLLFDVLSPMDSSHKM